MTAFLARIRSSSARWRCWRSSPWRLPSARSNRNPDGSVNPTASSVREEQLLQELDRISGRGTIPDQKACTHRAAGRPRLARSSTR